MIVELARWRIDCDRAATIDCCSRLPVGSGCTCSTCRNFMAPSAAAFPASFRAIADQLGIDVGKPAELCHYAREASGLHLVGGWFHFVGSLLSGADAWTPAGTPSLARLPEGIELGFTTKLALVHDVFRGHRVVQLEFTTRVPWVIPDAEAT